MTQISQVASDPPCVPPSPLAAPASHGPPGEGTDRAGRGPQDGGHCAWGRGRAAAEGLPAGRGARVVRRVWDDM